MSTHSMKLILAPGSATGITFHVYMCWNCVAFKNNLKIKGFACKNTKRKQRV